MAIIEYKDYERYKESFVNYALPYIYKNLCSNNNEDEFIESIIQ